MSIYRGHPLIWSERIRESPLALARHLGRGGIGNDAPLARVGIGLDKPALSQVPEALDEARIALDMTSPTRPLALFADLDLIDALAHCADRVVLKLIPDWVRRAHADGSERDLFGTIRAFAECSLNVKETAWTLRVHPNTVYFRLKQIKKHTGVDPRTFAGTALLVTALRLLDDQRRQDGEN
jgi:sugar diacid utilization regulator